MILILVLAQMKTSILPLVFPICSYLQAPLHIAMFPAKVHDSAGMF